MSTSDARTSDVLKSICLIPESFKSSIAATSQRLISELQVKGLQKCTPEMFIRSCAIVAVSRDLRLSLPHPASGEAATFLSKLSPRPKTLIIGDNLHTNMSCTSINADYDMLNPRGLGLQRRSHVLLTAVEQQDDHLWPSLDVVISCGRTTLSTFSICSPSPATGSIAHNG